MKALTTAGVLLAGCCVAANSAAPVDWSQAERVELRMIEYDFVPNLLRFRRGQPYALHLVNAGKEGHDFTAPDFFAAVELKDRATFANGASIYLNPQETVDISFVARDAGLFAPRCADHDWVGMRATIIVE